MASGVRYRTDLEGVDWQRLKERLAEDAFDNGRTPDQLRQAFENSQAVVIAWAGDAVVGKARALSDGVSNAYVVDVWTYEPFRRRGVARRMLELLLSRLSGQHVYLFTDDAQGFYRKMGFLEQPTGMGQVVGRWLHPEGTRAEAG